MSCTPDDSDSAHSNTVLVTGGSGYVAQFVIATLLGSERWRVHSTHRVDRDTSGLPSAVQWHAIDYSDADDIGDLLRRLNPAIVVNCAAMGSLGACESDPAGAERANQPEAMVRAFGGLGGDRLFVHLSTDIVFAGDPNQTYDEDVSADPVNAYGASKAKFDNVLSQLKVPHCVVLRPTNIIGPRHPYVATGTKFLQWLDAQLQSEKQTTLFDDEYRNYVWVDDIVDIILRIMGDFPSKLPAQRLFHCGGPEPLNRVDVAVALQKAKGYDTTYTTSDGIQLQRIVPTPRASVNLGYKSPLVVRVKSDRVQEYLGRSLRNITTCLQEHVSRI